MLNYIETIVLISIFVVLLVVIFKAIESALGLGIVISCVLSVCVSTLCVIGMRGSFEDYHRAILLPYAALGISIILLMITFTVLKYFIRKKERLYNIEGQPPNLLNPPEGCAFWPRCDQAMDICRNEYPPMTPLDDQGFVNCWVYSK